MTKVLIIAGDSATAGHYRQAVEEHGVKCEVASTITDMKQYMGKTPFNGIILDVLTAIRSSLKDKIDIQGISEVYPILRVRWDERSGEIRGLVIGNLINKKDPLKDFLDKFCHPRPARTCRKNKRFSVHFNVLLSRNNDFPADQTEKTITMDISQGGCFLFSTQCWQDSEFAWLRFQDISDTAPVQIIVRRHCAWGKNMNIPGIGVEFTQINSTQLREIREHFTTS